MSSSYLAEPRGRDWLIFALVPLFMSSNLVLGRGIAGEVSPFTTAFIRWVGAVLVMLPLLYRYWPMLFSALRQNAGLLFSLGFMHILVCGGGVYWSLTHTTASNATLIYTTSPLFIILFERVFAGRKVANREFIGILIAFVGVMPIVLRGDLSAVLDLQFNKGDLGMFVASMAFAVYSILLRTSGARAIPPMVLFTLVALAGSLLILPIVIWEISQGGMLPHTTSAWTKLAGITLIASLANYLAFQHSVRVFGPPLAGTVLYTSTPASILLAVIFLGEDFRYYHAIGFVLVLGGVLLATLKLGSRKKA